MTKEIVHALNEINLSLYELTAAERNNGTTLMDVSERLREVSEQKERNTLNTSIRTLVRFCCERDCNRCIYHKAGTNKNSATGEAEKVCVLNEPFTWAIPQEDLT